MVASEMTFNHGFNHVGLSVIDLDAAVACYTKVLGFHQTPKILEFDRAHDPSSPIFSIYGATLHKGRFAFLISGNGVGLELFEFENPKSAGVTKSFDYSKGGFFHIAITDPDPPSKAREIEAAGGQIIGEPITMLEKNHAYCAYVQDPWGNVIELLNLNFAELAIRLSGVDEL
ncbi:hypothetical protein LTR84_009116 [Exophiala bonariae]|uniref:VOC domain-containing protein n=1 Tax=Exophiala bonariae TaxID=1690606 RepID=A0AAV9MYB7_9EURO|nr:hypothetical protein LTR84_009116 [Exophiala bonariae]